MKKIYLFVVLALVPLLTMCSGPYGSMMGGWDRTGNYGCPLDLAMDMEVCLWGYCF